MPEKTPTATIASPVADVREHKHCEVCGKATATDGRVCSPECQARFEEALRMRRRSVYIFIGLMALALLFGLYGQNIL
jgi:predicted nucleic acid-binding Zn ribbon protein